MTYDEFIALRAAGSVPSEIPELLKALLIDASGDWDEAHRIAQSISTAGGSWVHAYLHRKEGDRWNAAYWYRRAGRSMPEYSPDAEWEEIATELLKVKT